MSQQQTAQQVLNKALIKQTITIELFEQFRAKMNWLCALSEETGFEDYHKQNLIQFFKDTQFGSDYYINISDHIHLVIHNGKKAKDPIGVLIETKRPSNTAEMPTPDNLNKKGLQELILYYLRERITKNNLELKYLIVTNNLQWIIFDALTFEQLVYGDRELVRQFEQYRDSELSGIRTDFFYREIAFPFLERVKNDEKFIYTYFDLRGRKWDSDWKLTEPAEQKKQIALYRLLSPQHLLKLPIVNDSNTLDKTFYTELLHLIGLIEVKEGKKRLIRRKPMGKRENGSLLESAIFKIRPHLHEVESVEQYGENEEKQLFTIGLQLTITWINRILFLKLLEAQLLTYKTGDRFLNQNQLPTLADFDTLFFNVLAIPIDERDGRTRDRFSHVPYLNSSLFERTVLEQQLITIGNLKLAQLSVHLQTVLKDRQGRKRTGEMVFHEYLFDFLDAYDFGRDATADVVVEKSKKLINASVLGLIFEKINGYKDGSFFTPGQITMYMCREAVRSAVVQKFNADKKWNCETLNDVYDELETGDEARDKANEIVNAVRICDPAVGSGHFLVSALNELIAIKHELKILQDANGRRLKEYDIVVENDELIITDDDGDLFQYRPNNRESQRLQQTLFYEKQTLIENCLFGVDINLNSVKICRLRLWIELLKHAYFKNESGLETLPNIDINIKHGDSLISRFDFNADLSSALKQHQLTVESYQQAVSTYRNAKSGEEKREMERQIALIKSDWRQELQRNDEVISDLRKAESALDQFERQINLLEETVAEQKIRAAERKRLEKDVVDKKDAVEEKQNRYKGAFEWRFEFPEVLDENGNFVGFDLVIGNPPYNQLREYDNKKQNAYRQSPYYKYVKGDHDNIFQFFYPLAFQIARPSGFVSLLIQNSLLAEKSTLNNRKLILQNSKPIRFVSFPERDDVNKRVFHNVKMSVCIGFVQVGVSSSNLDNEFDVEVWQDRFFSRGYKLRLTLNMIRSLWPDTLIIPSSDQTSFQLLAKIKSISSDVILNAKSGEVDMKKFKHKFNTFEKGVRVLTGAQILRYATTKNPSQGSVLFLEDQFINFTSGRRSDIAGNRIVMQRVTGVDSSIRLIMTLVSENYLCANSTNYISDQFDCDLRVILGILNSTVANYIFKQTSTNTNVTTSEINDFPIRLPTAETQKQIIGLVQSLLDAGGQGGEVAIWERELDELVYDLYELTLDERVLVEATVGRE